MFVTEYWELPCAGNGTESLVYLYSCWKLFPFQFFYSSQYKSNWESPDACHICIPPSFALPVLLSGTSNIFCLHLTFPRTCWILSEGSSILQIEKSISIQLVDEDFPARNWNQSTEPFQLYITDLKYGKEVITTDTTNHSQGLLDTQVCLWVV